MAWRTHRSVPSARSLSPPRTGRVHRRHAARLNPACPAGRPHGRTAARGSTRCLRSPQGGSGLTLTCHPAARRGLLHSLVGSTRLRMLVVAIVVCAAGATVASVRTLALFTSTSQAPASFSAGRIFPGVRTTPGFVVHDASGGGAEVDRTSPFAVVGDGRSTSTSAWATAFAANRYIEFDLNAPLPAAVGASGVTLRLTVASASPSGTACGYVNVRRISDDASVATYGSPASPLGCVTGHHAGDPAARPARDCDDGRGERPPGPRVRSRQRRRGLRHRRGRGRRLDAVLDVHALPGPLHRRRELDPGLRAMGTRWPVAAPGPSRHSPSSPSRSATRSRWRRCARSTRSPGPRRQRRHRRRRPRRHPRPRPPPHRPRLPSLTPRPRRRPRRPRRPPKRRPRPRRRRRSPRPVRRAGPERGRDGGAHGNGSRRDAGPGHADTEPGSRRRRDHLVPRAVPGRGERRRACRRPGRGRGDARQRDPRAAARDRRPPRWSTRPTVPRPSRPTRPSPTSSATAPAAPKAPRATRDIRISGRCPGSAGTPSATGRPPRDARSSRSSTPAWTRPTRTSPGGCCPAPRSSTAWNPARTPTATGRGWRASSRPTRTTAWASPASPSHASRSCRSRCSVPTAGATTAPSCRASSPPWTPARTSS